MPPESLWLQYSIVGILLLTSTAIAGGFYRLWRELLGWIERENSKRTAERNAQREWDAEQARIRDERWQQFFRQMETEWRQDTQRSAAILAQLTDQIRELAAVINTHDAYVRGQRDR